VLGTKFARRAFSVADDAAVWTYGLLAVAVGLLAAAAALPKGHSLGLSGSLVLGLVGTAILLGLTIAYALG
jgi:hypothetical protein